MSFLYVYATEVPHCFAALYLVLCLPVSLDSVSSCISVHLAYQILLHNCTILTPEIGRKQCAECVGALYFTVSNISLSSVCQRACYGYVYVLERKSDAQSVGHILCSLDGQVLNQFLTSCLLCFVVLAAVYAITFCREYSRAPG